ncbi:MAG: apolipoprotein N-acyltransferase [Planctomycetes bacterium]|nr:apolipoprotein N-acyltransferase [Planctomycetota bacterium]
MVFIWGLLKSAGLWLWSAILAALPLSLPFFASAVILTVIHPPVGWAPLAWVSMVPFILACSPQIKPRSLALAAYLVSLLYWLANLYWVFPITIVGWVVFCLYTALLWPILALSLRYCRTKKVPLFLAAAVLIVGIERMQGLFLGGFLWRLLAHSQYRNITIIQIADIFGAGGVSFLIAMVNGLLAELIIAALSCHPERSEGSRLSLTIPRFSALLRMTILWKATVVGIAIVAALVYGRWRIAQSDKYIKPGPVVASLQSNVPQSVKRTFQAGKEIFDGLIKHSKAGLEAGAELIVWPETMVQATLNREVLEILDSSHPWRVLDEALREHAKDRAFLLVGAYGGIPDDSKAELVERYNSAFLYKPDGRQYERRYDKIHLVPFGEVLPFRKSLPWLYNVLMKFTPYSYDYSLDYGSEYTVFEMTGGVDGQRRAYKFGVIICYEDVVPYIARRFALDQQGRKRLDWLVNISNDGWFVRFDEDSGEVRPSAELAQHAAICVFRAVENRLSVVRSVNTGISCIIDSLGNIRDTFTAGTLPRQAMARKGMAGWFSDKLPIDKRVTFFSKYGEWLDFCCQGCVILFIIVSLLAKLLGLKRYGTDLSGRSNGKHAERIHNK